MKKARASQRKRRSPIERAAEKLADVTMTYLRELPAKEQDEWVDSFSDYVRRRHPRASRASGTRAKARAARGIAGNRRPNRAARASR